MDKTLADELTALAEWLESEAYDLVVDGHRDMAKAFDARAAEVRAMAERVAGCVVVKPVINPAWGGYDAGIDPRVTVEDATGPTPETAIAALQTALDQQK